ncbi:MAG TPA: hypothetical protein VEL28_05325 [Candidatus Binatia bacterium]|nr:hypothetical protein [Candidatus Binatia bacterium]
MVRFQVGLVALVSLISAAVATTVPAAPITFDRTEQSVDLVSAGVGGVGNETATINLTGVSGSVRKAYLYWHGVDLVENGGDGIYDNAAILFGGQPVIGASIGDTSSNCWGEGSSRAYRADVTSIVTGNGNYSISGLAGKPGHEGNGASLVVTFNDGNPINDRDFMFFEGNDADNPQGFNCADDGGNTGISVRANDNSEQCRCKVQGDEDCDGDVEGNENDAQCHKNCENHDGDCNPHCEDDRECHGSCNPHDGYCNPNCKHDDDCDDEDCDDGDGVCNEKCDDDTDCNPSCSPNDGICNEECSHDDDCDEEECDDDDGDCNPACDDDDDCTNSCSPHDGVCNPRCHNDDDCEECDDNDGVCNEECPHDKDCHMSCNPHDDICNPRCKNDDDCTNNCDDDDGVCNPDCADDDDCENDCDDDDGVCNPNCVDDDDCDECDDDDGVCTPGCGVDDDDCTTSCDDDDGVCNPQCADDDDCDTDCDDNDGICNEECDDDDDCDEDCDDDDGVCNLACIDDDDCDEEPCDHTDGKCDESCDGDDDDCNSNCDDNDGQCNPDCANDEDCGEICTDTDTDGWHFLLENIDYGTGPVSVQMHVADGQKFGNGQDDDDLVFSSAAGSETIDDSGNRWDGNSVPDADNTRAQNGALWDIHTLNITDAFDESGEYDIEVDGMDDSRDCKSLVVAIVNVAQRAAGCGNGVLDQGEECDPDSETNTCGGSLTCTSSCECGCDSAADCNDGIECTLDTCNVIDGACLHNAETCVCPAECGNPREDFERVTAVDSQHILNTVVELVQCPLCVCDVNSTGHIFADDALNDLRHAVGQPVPLVCPDLPPDE